jgi:Holliday junction resolvase RusA-like endonuclease
LRAFEESIRRQIAKNLTQEHPYPKDVKLEVDVAVSMTERRFKQVDIDNLVKSVLDCMNGLVYVDDTQIVNILGTKDVNAFEPRNALFIGVRKINEQEDSWFKGIKLAYFEYEDEDGNPVTHIEAEKYVAEKHPPLKRKNKKPKPQ